MIIVIDGTETPVNIDKDSFWNDTCGELIHKHFRAFKDRHSLKPGDRVWLKVLVSHCKFCIEL